MTSRWCARWPMTVIVMRNGRVVEYGPSKQIFEKPQSEYTRALISAAFRIEAAPVGAVSE